MRPSMPGDIERETRTLSRPSAGEQCHVCSVIYFFHVLTPSFPFSSPLAPSHPFTPPLMQAQFESSGKMVALARLLIESGVILPEESPSRIFDSHDPAIEGGRGGGGRGEQREDAEVRTCYILPLYSIEVFVN